MPSDTENDLERAEAFIFDRPNNERRISGALRSCIEAHGPITPEWIGSAAKRAEATLRSAYKSKLRDQPEPALTVQIEECQARLRGLYEARAGTMIDDERGWCSSCGSAVVDFSSGFDTCAGCMGAV